jgi:hypothetical protein
MAALARGQTSDCTQPILDLYTRVSSVLTDMYSVSFQIYEKVSNPGTPVQVYPAVPGDKQALNVTDLCPTGHKLTIGHYVAEYTPELTELLGTHLIQWYFKLTASSPEQTFCEEFEVLPEATGSTGVGYTTVAALREEGVPDPPTDARLQTLIMVASRQIDQWTARWFEPRAMVFHLDGTGTRSIHLEAPIISVSEVVIEDDTVLLLEDVTVYNRHITENLTFPDDRQNPRLEVYQNLRDELRFSLGLKVFPVGQQNIKVTGVFGYTDYDGSPNGSTPVLIEQVCKMLVMRMLQPMYTADPTSEAVVGHRVIEMKTRDQTIKLAGPEKTWAAGSWPYTGDPAIDQIIMSFRAPPRLRSV